MDSSPGSSPNIASSKSSTNSNISELDKIDYLKRIGKLINHPKETSISLKCTYKTESLEDFRKHISKEKDAPKTRKNSEGFYECTSLFKSKKTKKRFKKAIKHSIGGKENIPQLEKDMKDFYLKQAFDQFGKKVEPVFSPSVASLPLPPYLLVPPTPSKPEESDDMKEPGSEDQALRALADSSAKLAEAQPSKKAVELNGSDKPQSPIFVNPLDELRFIVHHQATEIRYLRRINEQLLSENSQLRLERNLNAGGNSPPQVVMESPPQTTSETFGSSKKRKVDEMEEEEEISRIVQ